MRERLVVVGNGMVGQKFLEHLVAVGLHRRYQVCVLCSEPRAAYDRVNLSGFFSGRSAADLSLVPDGFFEEHGIELRLNESAAHIDRNGKVLHTSRGEVLNYDKLVLATGSCPFVPSIPGRDRSGCFVYRTVEDLQAIAGAALNSEIGVVIGGGLLGLEAAKALRDAGLQTHVVEFAPWLMSVQVDQEGGDVLRRKIEELGVFVHTSKNTKEIIGGEFYNQRLNFADGSHLETDLLIFSAGIRPRDQVAGDAGLELGERGGVVVDNFCRSSDGEIYAIGECALWEGRVFGLVAPGYEMARVAAEHLASEADAEHPAPRPFRGADMSTKLKLLGIDVASLGDAHARTPGARCFQYLDQSRQIYKKLVVSGDGRRLLGAVLVGDAKQYNNLLQLMLNQIELPENPQSLILPDHGVQFARALP